MSADFNVTLDGPAGVGKTTLAKRLAGALGLAYLDTGAMYRAMAWRLGEGAENDPLDRLAARIRKMEFSLEGVGAGTRLLLDGDPLGDEIRTEEVAARASSVARLPVVREYCTRAQQAMGSRTAVVAEGRDMGTVVFPGARYKFFLDAAPEERARRRVEQLKEAGRPADLAAITEQIRARDHQDRTREIAPLKPAPDAVIVDTTHLDADGVFQALLAGMGRG
jgi:cytidylate kinase